MVMIGGAPLCVCSVCSGDGVPEGWAGDERLDLGKTLAHHQWGW